MLYVAVLLIVNVIVLRDVASVLFWSAMSMVAASVRTVSVMIRFCFKARFTIVAYVLAAVALVKYPDKAVVIWLATAEVVV